MSETQTEPAPSAPPSPPADSAPAQPQDAKPAEQTAQAPPPGPQPKRDPVPFEPDNVDDMWRYAKMLAGASLLPRAYYERDDRERRHPRIADVHFVLLKGQALGLHPTVSISTINIIDGKAEIGAQLMVALCLKSGLCEYFELVRSDDRSATFATKRTGGRREIEFTYTIEEADQMGLLDKGKSDWARENNQWKKQPRTMLRRRCQAMLAREVYPDVVMGLYDHEEISELREREKALGIDSDRVIQVDDTRPDVDDRGAPTDLALPPGEARQSLRSTVDDLKANVNDRERIDPLKARLHARGAARKAERALDVEPPPDDAPRLGPGEVPCAGCQVPVEGKKGARCTACLNS